MNPKNMCMGCMKEKTSSTPLCPLCGYDESERRSPLVMRHRTLLADQYVVGRVLGKPGGFGITYLGWDTRLETMVAIKEYLPRDVGRDTDRITVVPHSREDEEIFRYGLEAFLLEARTLAKFNHASVVRVRTFFEANGTAYLVMDYYDGMSLESYLIEKGGQIPEKLAVDIMMPILDGLREVHEKGFLHRDIKPHNIYLTTGNLPILLDFGAARFAMGEKSKNLSVVLTPGYAPYEQYHRKGRQGSWTDIYACAATLYRMVTGKTPPEATERQQEDDLIPPDRIANVSLGFQNAVMQALSTNITNRPQSVRAFQDMLFNVSKQSSPPPPPNFQSSPPPPPNFQSSPPPLPPQPELQTPEPPYRPSPPPIPPISQSSRSASPPPLPTQQLQQKSGTFKLLFIGLVVTCSLLFTYNTTRQKGSSSSYVEPASSPVSVTQSSDAGDVIDGPLPGMKFTYIPPGEFMMGSPSSEPGRDNNETRHRVKLTKGFYMQTTEVTQGQWKAVMGSNSLNFSSCGDNCPVENVSWNDVQDFIKRLNRKGSRQYRLPTEAEWEYACRAGTTTAYSFGNDPSQLSMYGNFCDKHCGFGVSEFESTKDISQDDGHEYIAPVKSFRPNLWGLYDMHGNVLEWCQDSYDDYNPSGLVTDPNITLSSSTRILRGGGFPMTAQYCRSSARVPVPPELHNIADMLDGIGFRLVFSKNQQ